MGEGAGDHGQNPQGRAGPKQTAWRDREGLAARGASPGQGMRWCVLSLVCDRDGLLGRGPVLLLSCAGVG